MFIIDRYHPHRRQQSQAAFEAGRFRQCDELALLSESQLRPLALLSLWLLLAGIVVFGVLPWFLFVVIQKQAIVFSPGGIVVGVVLNILAYVLILPLHEAIHALIILIWGGRPHFGIKFLSGTGIPLALYCGAEKQLFRRNVYLGVALAPLVVISLAGLILTLLVPSLASYFLLATAGNISGAAGDVLVAWRLFRFPSHTLVEDTETGYRAWQLMV